jgi:anti-sigma factor RsiW
MNEIGDKLTATVSRAACAWADAVAAYLDGELEAGETFVFEEHLKSCDSCPTALTEQRRLTGLITAAVSGPHEAVVLPKDFARVVTARAQSDMTCVRGAPEKRRAALLVLALAAVATALIGAGGWSEVFAPAAQVARGVAGVSAFALRSAGEIASGAALLLRGVGGLIVQARPDGPTRLLSVALLACALVLLLGLITKYRRTYRPD